jgi:hypothetical protein
VFDNRVLGISGQSREDAEIYVTMSCIIYRPAVCCSRRMNLEEHGVYVEEYPNVYTVLEGTPKKVGT